MTPELREACTRAAHVITPSGRVLRGGRAVLFILHGLGYRRAARLLALRPGVWAVEGGYRLVAANRALVGRIFSRGAP